MTACICKNTVLHLSADFKIIKMNVANAKRINNSGKFKMSHKTLRNAHEHEQIFLCAHISKIRTVLYKNVHSARTFVNLDFCLLFKIIQPV